MFIIMSSNRSLASNIVSSSFHTQTNDLSTETTQKQVLQAVINSSTTPITGSVSANITNNSLAVTGTFYPQLQPVSGSVDINNIVTTNQTISDNNYDLELAGPLLYADSSPTFIENTQGDNGWYYQSFNTTSASNVYFYGNDSNFVQSDIMYSKVECIFSVVDLDFIGTSANNLPFLVLRTKAGGVQTYVIPSTETLILNEKILLYANVGTYTTYSLPNSLYPGVRRIKCQLMNNTVTDLTSPILNIAVNTATLSQSVRYTLHHAGFSFLKGTTSPFIDTVITWNFINSKARKAETNLSKLAFTTANNANSLDVNVKNTVAVSGSVTVSGNIGNSSFGAKLQDGTGTPITSTTVSSKQGLDVNLVGGSISVSSVNIKDSLGNNITSISSGPNAGSLNTFNQILNDSYLSSTTAIQTIPKLLVKGSSPNTYLAARCSLVGDQYVNLSTNADGNQVKFDTSTTTSNQVKIDPSNNVVALSSNTVQLSQSGTQNTVKIDSSNNTVALSTSANTVKLDTANNTVKVGDSFGNVSTALPSGSSNRCLNTISHPQAYDSFLNNYFPLYTTSSENGRGLNTYQIMPKTRTFNMAGNATNVANVMWAGLGSTIDVASLSWGTDLPAKIFYFYHTTSPVTPLSCILNYIKKSNGKEATYTINTPADAPSQNVYYNLFNAPFNLTDIACINSFNTVGSTVSATSYRILTSNSDLTKSVASIHNTDLQYCGFFTCPANARAFVSYLSVVVTTSGDYLKFIKWTKEGYRRVINTIYCFTQLNNVFTASSDNGASSLSGWIYPGETFAINATLVSTNRQGSWNITVIYDD